MFHSIHSFYVPFLVLCISKSDATVISIKSIIKCPYNSYMLMRISYHIKKQHLKNQNILQVHTQIKISCISLLKGVSCKTNIKFTANLNSKHSTIVFNYKIKTSNL